MAIENRQPVRFDSVEAFQAGTPEGRWELLEGVLYFHGLPVYPEELAAAWRYENVGAARPSWDHQRIGLRLARFLDAFLDEHPLGQVNLPADVRLSPSYSVQPDLLFVAVDGKAHISSRGVEGAPDLVVEIVSPSSRRSDALEKRTLYEIHGVQEYWLIWPEEECVDIYRRQDAGFLAPVTLRPGANLSSPLLPGFSIPVQLIFPERRD